MSCGVQSFVYFGSAATIRRAMNASEAMDPISLGLPHRPPFIFVDSVDQLEAGLLAHCSKTFRRSESFFQGHFPGNAIVPGVLLVEGMAQTAGIAVGGPGKNVFACGNSIYEVFASSSARGTDWFQRPQIGRSRRTCSMLRRGSGWTAFGGGRSNNSHGGVAALNHCQNDLDLPGVGSVAVRCSHQAPCAGFDRPQSKNERNDVKDIQLRSYQ